MKIGPELYTICKGINKMEFNIKLTFVFIMCMILNFNVAAKEKISLLAPYDEMSGISIFSTLIPYQQKLPMWNY